MRGKKPVPGRGERLAWLSDIHLNFISDAQVRTLCQTIDEENADAVLISGDIAEADSLEHYLSLLDESLSRPIYFVLGNHDFYGGSVAETRTLAERISRRSPWLRWLPAAGAVALGPKTALVGHDGWGDGRLGRGAATSIRLNDEIHIEDLRGLSRKGLFAKMLGLGEEARDYLREVLPPVLRAHEHVLLLTHVPPFREACWHDGRISDDDWLPYFTCKAVGDLLLNLMKGSPSKMTVLCGHTHGAGAVDLLPNLRVLTAGADYGRPRLDRIVSLAEL